MTDKNNPPMAFPAWRVWVEREADRQTAQQKPAKQSELAKVLSNETKRR